MYITKITLIKIIRNLTNYGLVDAKRIADKWFEIESLGNGDILMTEKVLISFTKFLGAFVNGSIGIEDNKIIWLLNREVTKEDIEKLVS